MPTGKRLLAAGLATFIIGIALTFPARIAYNWFAPPELRLSGISGTVWKGIATEGSAGGIYLRNLQWNFLPLNLLKGQLAYAVTSDSAFGSLQSDVGVSVGGALVLTNVDSDLSLSGFRDLFQLNGFEGAVQVRFTTLTFEDGLPTDARGSIRLSNLLAPQLSPLVIGDYLAEFSGSADGVVASVEDTSGVLDVAGTITVSKDRSYEFIGKVAASPEAPAGLTDQLRFLGSPDARGYRDFRIEGRL